MAHGWNKPKALALKDELHKLVNEVHFKHLKLDKSQMANMWKKTDEKVFKAKVEEKLLVKEYTSRASQQQAIRSIFETAGVKIWIAADTTTPEDKSSPAERGARQKANAVKAQFEKVDPFRSTIEKWLKAWIHPSSLQRFEWEGTVLK